MNWPAAFANMAYNVLWAIVILGSLFIFYQCDVERNKSVVVGECVYNNYTGGTFHCPPGITPSPVK